MIVLGGETHFNESGQDLIGFTIPSGHKCSDIIVPVGDTLLLEDDKVIMIKVDHAIKFPKVDETE